MTRYRTIVADPPWAYEQSRIVTTARTAKTRPEADAQYGPLTIAEICALDVPSLGAVDAHLYLWATNPILPHAFEVVAAWGFTYRTMLTWRKTGTLGMGYYFRGDTEHVLFATRGKLPIPAAERVRNWFEAPKRGHSIKPDCFLDMVEQVSPGPRLEMFARRARMSGWDYYGDESLGTAAMPEGEAA
jgi:N6-adenosine-specific RNA methylase IME4